MLFGAPPLPATYMSPSPVSSCCLQIKCFHKKQHSNNMELIFRVQFHTSFVKDHEMVFVKEELDEAHRGVC